MTVPMRLEVHYCRIFRAYPVEQLDQECDLPVDCYVATTSATKDVHEEVSRRQLDVASRRLQWLDKYNHPQFITLLTAVYAMNDHVRRATHRSQLLVMPDKNVQHTNPAAQCAACQAAFLAAPGNTPEKYVHHLMGMAAYQSGYKGLLTPNALLRVEDDLNGII